jgi:hypothetical protein
VELLTEMTNSELPITMDKSHAALKKYELGLNVLSYYFHWCYTWKHVLSLSKSESMMNNLMNDEKVALYPKIETFKDEKRQIDTKRESQIITEHSAVMENEGHGIGYSFSKSEHWTYPGKNPWENTSGVNWEYCHMLKFNGGDGTYLTDSSSPPSFKVPRGTVDFRLEMSHENKGWFKIVDFRFIPKRKL